MVEIVNQPSTVHTASGITNIIMIITNHYHSTVWNSANTYEERNFNNWGIDKIKSILNEFTVSSSSFTIGLITLIIIKYNIFYYPFFIKDITSSEVSGTATIAHVRGKARYIYDFNIKLTFEISKDSNTYKGSFQIDDLSPDDLDDINIQINWTKEPSSSDFSTIKTFINKEFKAEFKKKVHLFEKEFRAI